MEYLLNNLIFYLPIVVLSSVILVVLINVYFKIRRKFLVKVNCWFCNEWTCVPYSEQNCFECSSCLQYNGFDSNGDYNRPIPEQQDELLNKATPKSLHSTQKYPASNGLCHLCNNNQQLKIFQLASFIPLCEDNYDVEIEHFQKQLEKAYKLCPKCEKVVKTTIHKQNYILGLKFSKLRKRAVSLLDLNISSDGISKSSKLLFIKSFLTIFLVTFSVLNLGHGMMQLDLSDNNLKRLSPNWMITYVLAAKSLVLNYYKFVENYFVTNSDKWSGVEVLRQNIVEKLPTFMEQLPYFNSTSVSKLVENHEAVMAHLPKSINKGTVLLGFAGSLLQLILIFWKDDIDVRIKLIEFLLWNVITYGHWIASTYLNWSGYLNAVQIVSSLIIINLKFRSSFTRKPTKVKHVLKHLKRRNPVVEDYAFSDEEELDQYSSTFKHFSDNLDFSNKNLFAKSNSPAIFSLRRNENPVFGQPAMIENVFAKRRSATSSSSSNVNRVTPIFSAARSCVSNKSSVVNSGNLFNNENLGTKQSQDSSIEEILNNLNLGSPSSGQQQSSNLNVFKSKPIISPAKLKTVTQNSWVAGGFWLDPNGVPVSSNGYSNIGMLSRSSSQTSGFASQTGGQEIQNLNSGNSSYCGDYDNRSVLSEPSCFVYGKGYGSNSKFVWTKQGNRGATCYPVMNQEHFVYMSPSVQRYECSPQKVDSFRFSSPITMGISKPYGYDQ